MPSGKTAERERRKQEEIAEIGPEDYRRLHEGMNDSRSSSRKTTQKQANHATGRRDSGPGEPTSRGLTSTSGFKRRSSAGAGPSEPTPTTLNKSTRATTRRPMGLTDLAPNKPKRRNDLKTRNNQKQMKGSAARAKHFT